ncbi:MAG: hypothetical protein L0Y71_10180 [Gemmataceae bacterium]|nr:hypothetical protein [Gemmataceae bacterium]
MGAAWATAWGTAIVNAADVFNTSAVFSQGPRGMRRGKMPSDADRRSSTA